MWMLSVRKLRCRVVVDCNARPCNAHDPYIKVRYKGLAKLGGKLGIAEVNNVGFLAEGEGAKLESSKSAPTRAIEIFLCWTLRIAANKKRDALCKSYLTAIATRDWCYARHTGHSYSPGLNEGDKEELYRRSCSAQGETSDKANARLEFLELHEKTNHKYG